MGKTLLDLFKTGNLDTIGTPPGVPIPYNGTTPKDKYQVRNSKDIPQEAASPYMNAPLSLLNKLRLKKGLTSSVTETFLEEEATGLRPLRTLSIPLIYGTDSVRIIGGGTQDVRKMKDSRGDTVSRGKIANFVSNVGKKIDQISDKVKNALGVPQPLYPSAFIGDKIFTTSPSNRTPETLAEIKKDRSGSVLGKLLADSAKGTPQQIARQAIGGGLSLAKGAIRTGLFGSRTETIASGSYNGFAGQYADKETKDSIGPYSKTMEAYIQSDAKNQIDISGVSPISGLYRDDGKYGKTPYALTIKKQSDKSSYVDMNDLINTYNSPTSPHTGTDTSDIPTTGYPNAQFDTDDGQYPNGVNSPLREVFLKDTNTNIGGILDSIRPTKLKGNESPKLYSDKSNEITTPYGRQQLSKVSLEDRRGIFSDRDILNQTGRFSKEEIKELNYNGKQYQDVDLIPLRFQRMNDHSAVYLRTILTSFSETFTPSWEGQNMIGNPFKFYTYSGIERKVSFNVKVYAMSQWELIMMWRRLEYLAHLTYPFDYTAAGAVEPTLFWLTLGSMYVNKPAILTSLTYTIDDAQNLWEIGGTVAQAKKGTVVTNNGRVFFADADNGKEYSKGKGKGQAEEPRVDKKPGKKTEYTRIGKKDKNDPSLKNNVGEISLNEKGEPLLWETDIFVNATNRSSTEIKMDEYKLPKFINAQFDITFLESKDLTNYNVYGYGQPITYGVGVIPSDTTGAGKPPPSPPATETSTTPLNTGAVRR
jgi:hypothetical protein